MISLFITLGLLFAAIGFIITEHNAHYLLSGYNTLSEEGKKTIDLKKYVPRFRKFHLFLGFSFMAGGLLLIFLVNESVAAVFLGTYPILAYVYFAWIGSKQSGFTLTKWHKGSIVAMLVSLIAVGIIFVVGFKESHLDVGSEGIELDGGYGETIARAEIKSVTLVNQLPQINFKSDGFAVGGVRKGYFVTKQGEKVKLILNSSSMPCILITKTDGGKIYYSATDSLNRRIYTKIQHTFSGGF